MTKVRILATGPEFVKKGFRGTGPVIEETIRDAKKEIQILAYVISPHALKILNMLEDSLQRGIKVKIVLNKFSDHEPEIKQKLTRMKKQYELFEMVDFHRTAGDLHAKVLVADRKIAVIGSANFSWGGMAKNYEIGVIFEDEAAWELSKLIDDLA